MYGLNLTGRQASRPAAEGGDRVRWEPVSFEVAVDGPVISAQLREHREHRRGFGHGQRLAVGVELYLGRHAAGLGAHAIAFGEHGQDAGSERVVGGNRLVGHTERSEHYCRHQARAVLSGRAEEHSRMPVGIGDQLHDRREPIAEAVEHHQVDLIEREARRGVDASPPGLVDDRPVVHDDAGVDGGSVGMVVELVRGAEIDGGTQPERGDDVPNVCLTQRRERVTPEHAPVAHDASVGGGVAPQVPEVGRTLELDMARRAQRSSSSMRMALPRTSLYTTSSGSPAINSCATFFVCGHVESVCG